MKRRKILVLIPMLGLFLSGCSFSDGFRKAKSIISSKLYHPLKDFVKGILGEDEKKEESPTVVPEGGDEGGEQGGGETVAVTGVTLDKSSASIEVDATVQLTATVAPNNATNKNVTWETSAAGVATVSSAGLVKGIAAGTAVITVKSAADATKTASCTVTVKEKSTPPSGDEPGSANKPYTTAEARAAVDAGEGIQGVYATGIVNRIAYAFKDGSMSFYFSDDGSVTNEVEAYKLAATEDPGLEIGDKVVVKGDLIKYNTTYEFAAGCTLEKLTKATVQSVAISGSASKTEYTVSEPYNHNGLVATATFDNGASIDVSSLADWSITPETATAGDEEIAITATYKEVPSAVFKVDVSVSSEEVVYYDATMTKGASASYDDVKINGNAAIKMGTSKVGGTMTITVPSGATKLKFYAIAWKGEGGSSCPITLSGPEGVTVDPESFNPEASAVLSGSEKEFDVGELDSFLVEVKLSGVTADTAITLTSTKRAIVCCAQYAK